jgi:hypothetical protein
MTDLELLFKRLRSLGAEGKVRDDEWLKRIRLLPCVVCGAESAEPHHWASAYTGMKCNDYLTVPVCRKCHTEIHVSENTAQTRLMLLEAWVRLMLKYLGGNRA